MMPLESRYAQMQRLETFLADPETDAKCWLFFDDIGPAVPDSLTYATANLLEKVLIGTWADVFGGTLTVLPSLGPDFNVVLFEAEQQSYLNETGAIRTAYGWMVLLHGPEQIWTAGLTSPPAVLNPMDTFRFTPYQRIDSLWSY